MSVATVQNADILEALSQGKHCHMFTCGKGSDLEASKRNITGNYVDKCEPTELVIWYDFPSKANQRTSERAFMGISRRQEQRRKMNSVWTAFWLFCLFNLLFIYFHLLQVCLTSQQKQRCMTTNWFWKKQTNLIHHFRLTYFKNSEF